MFTPDRIHCETHGLSDYLVVVSKGFSECFCLKCILKLLHENCYSQTHSNAQLKEQGIINDKVD